MLENNPYPRYNRRHHPAWIFRHSFPSGKYLWSWLPTLLVGILMVINKVGDVFLILLGAILALMTLNILTRLLCYFLKWLFRRIHLYSDGRMEYKYGIWSNDVISASMRFGIVRYRYHDRIGRWLDYADLELPFNEGTIECVPNFREFWEIAQGRR